jgi:hypothetical protein
MVQILYDGDCVSLLIGTVHIMQMYTFSLFNYLITVTTNLTNMDWWPFTSKDTDILMKNRMNICHIELRHAQTTKTTTTKTKTIQDYLGGNSVQKSTCLHQLGSSLQLGLISLFPENDLVCCMHSVWICLEWGRCCACYPLPAPYITMRDFFGLF